MKATENVSGLISCERAWQLLPDDQFQEARKREQERPGSVAVVALAGRDSIAAILKALEEDEHIELIVPTNVGTGTEYGNLTTIVHAADYLADRIEALFPGREVAATTPIRFGNPELWASLNGTQSALLQDLYGMNSPCLGCHLYVHLVRVPLTLALGSHIMISGERDTHDGRIKLSQTADSIDSETRVLARAGIELRCPIRALSGDEIGQLVPSWQEGADQLECVHSGNFKLPDGTVAYDRAAHVRYLEEFFEPAGNELVARWVEQHEQSARDTDD